MFSFTKAKGTIGKIDLCHFRATSVIKVIETKVVKLPYQAIVVPEDPTGIRTERTRWRQ